MELSRRALLHSMCPYRNGTSLAHISEGEQKHISNFDAGAMEKEFVQQAYYYSMDQNQQIDD